MNAENNGMILQCDDAGVISAVLLSNLAQLPVSGWAGVSLLSLIDPASEEATLFLLESVKEFGHAEAWPISFKVGEEVLSFFCNAVRIDNTITIIIYQSDGHIISLDRSSEAFEPNVTSDNYLATPGTSESELLDELSRLNNDLINTKRELIRQNVKLKRLQNPWEEGLTFI